jgi:hypothetical protein
MSSIIMSETSTLLNCTRNNLKCTSATSYTLLEVKLLFCTHIATCITRDRTERENIYPFTSELLIVIADCISNKKNKKKLPETFVPFVKCGMKFVDLDAIIMSCLESVS